MTKSELLARVPVLYRVGRAFRERGHDHAKQILLREFARRYGLRVLVETGTYMGETAWLLRNEFRRIETVELEPTLARLARIRFARTPNVHVHEGDSASVLPDLLARLDEPALFWLDAHPSTDRTARGTPIPLRTELDAIAAHDRGHVILIDDLRLLGRNGYPSRAELTVSGYTFDEAGDVGVLTRVE